MPIVMRRTSPQVANLATVTNNDAKRTGTSGGTNYHLDASEVTVTAANGAGTLAAALTLVNQIKGVYNFHCADALVLKAVDSTNPSATAAATDLATAITLANALKVSYTAHIALAASHYVTDVTNSISAANATDQASLDTLCNDLKAKLNAHMAATSGSPAVSGVMIRLVPA